MIAHRNPVSRQEAAREGYYGSAKVFIPLLYAWGVAFHTGTFRKPGGRRSLASFLTVSTAYPGAVGRYYDTFSVTLQQGIRSAKH